MIVMNDQVNNPDLEKALFYNSHTPFPPPPPVDQQIDTIFHP